MFGDEVEDLRLDLSGFNTPLGDLVSGGEWRGKETGVGGGGEEEPSSSLKWKVGLVRLVGSAPREVNAPERTGCIVGMQNTKREKLDHIILCINSYFHIGKDLFLLSFSLHFM